MMKYNKIRLLRAFASVLLLGGVLSCKDFLEIEPKGNLIAQKTADYDLLLNNLELLNMTSEVQVPMGDEIAAVDPYFSGAALRIQRTFKWDDVIYEPNEDAPEFAAPVKAIYTYNKIISEVMDSDEGMEQQKTSLKSEAMAGRAWTNFLLVNLYAKPYTVGAATEAGFPLITKANVTETEFNRATIQEVYDLIIQDLQAAIPNLPDQATHRLRISKPAAEGLLGKVYTFMGKFDMALPHLNTAITGLGNATIPVQLYDYNITFGPGGIFTPIGPNGPVYPTTINNQENFYCKQYFNFWASMDNEFVIAPQTVALYKPSDLRLKFFSKMPYSGSTPYPAGMMRRIGPIQTQFGVTVPDLYLLRAECKARLNDLSGATTDVETLRRKRMPAADAAVPSAVAGEQTALVKFILEERLREYAGTGFRWFDMRRLSVDPEYKSTVGSTHSLYTATGSITSFTLRAERLVLKFPQKVADQNPGFTNNP